MFPSCLCSVEVNVNQSINPLISKRSTEVQKHICQLVNSRVLVATSLKELFTGRQQEGFYYEAEAGSTAVFVLIINVFMFSVYDLCDDITVDLRSCSLVTDPGGGGVVFQGLANR